MALVKYKKLYLLVVTKDLWRCSLRGSASNVLNAEVARYLFIIFSRLRANKNACQK